ncbi:MAG: tRNA1(Val) (adenine(37)-N6)-methyltransferase [Eubacteriales bacterium]
MQSDYLKNGERLDTVNDGLSLIQKRDGFLFGTDSVALADFVRQSYKNTADLGTGSGIISLLLLQRERAERVYGVEIQPTIADMARRNAEMNGYSDRLIIIQGDIKAPDTLVPPQGGTLIGSLDAVFSNPPYMRSGAGLSSPDGERDISRREVCCDINDVCSCASRLLKWGGDFYIVHRPDRLCSLMCALRDNGLEPKQLELIVPRPDAPPCLVLVRAKKGAGEELKVTVRSLELGVRS